MYISKKNKPRKNTRNHGNLMKRTQLHEKLPYKFQENIALPFVLEKNVRKTLISVED